MGSRWRGWPASRRRAKKLPWALTVDSRGQNGPPGVSESRKDALQTSSRCMAISPSDNGDGRRPSRSRPFAASNERNVVHVWNSRRRVCGRCVISGPWWQDANVRCRSRPRFPVRMHRCTIQSKAPSCMSLREAIVAAGVVRDSNHRSSWLKAEFLPSGVDQGRLAYAAHQPSISCPRARTPQRRPPRVGMNLSKRNVRRSGTACVADSSCQPFIIDTMRRGIERSARLSAAKATPSNSVRRPCVETAPGSPPGWARNDSK
jgi:hypothetical protein